MRRTGGILASAVVVVLVAGCGEAVGTGGDNGPKSALGFVAHPDATQFPSPDGKWVPANVGLKALVPVGDCAVGIGDYANGYREVSANWKGADDCARLEIHPSPGSGGPGPEIAGEAGKGPRGGGLTAVAAVPGPAGSVLGVGAGSGFARLDASGEVVQLTELRGKRQASALVRSGKNLVALGTAFLDANATEPVAWVSDDDGVTERTVVLPRDPAIDGASGPHSAAADGEQILAASFAGVTAQVWLSKDAGGSWTVSKLPPLPKDANIEAVLRVGGEWMLVGASHDGRAPNVPLIVTGEPGNWKIHDAAPLGTGDIVGGTIDKAGRLILVGKTSEPYEERKNTRYCSVVRVLEAGGWQRGELGCSESPVTSAVTLADGRVLLAGNRDLWLR